MEETNNESIEKKLAYLNETKGLIKSAIINKGQELTDETPFRDYVQKIDDIETGVDTSDATALASDLLKGKTAYNAEGKIEGTLELKDGDVKLFETKAEMQSDPNAQEGDLAIVYMNKIEPVVNGDSNFTAYFADTIVVPTTITATSIFSSVNIGTNLYIKLTKKSCFIGTLKVLASYNALVTYSSTDGKTYTKTKDVDTAEIIDINTTVANYLAFFNKKAVNFSGMYKYIADTWEHADVGLTPLLPAYLDAGVKAYGNNGTVEGDGSIYDYLTPTAIMNTLHGKENVTGGDSSASNMLSGNISYFSYAYLTNPQTNIRSIDTKESETIKQILPIKYGEPGDRVLFDTLYNYKRLSDNSGYSNTITEDGKHMIKSDGMKIIVDETIEITLPGSSWYYRMYDDTILLDNYLYAFTHSGTTGYVTRISLDDGTYKSLSYSLSGGNGIEYSSIDHIYDYESNTMYACVWVDNGSTSYGHILKFGLDFTSVSIVKTISNSGAGLDGDMAITDKKEIVIEMKTTTSKQYKLYVFDMTTFSQIAISTYSWTDSGPILMSHSQQNGELNDIVWHIGNVLYGNLYGTTMSLDLSTNTFAQDITTIDADTFPNKYSPRENLVISDTYKTREVVDVFGSTVSVYSRATYDFSNTLVTPDDIKYSTEEMQCESGMFEYPRATSITPYFNGTKYRRVNTSEAINQIGWWKMGTLSDYDVLLIPVMMTGSTKYIDGIRLDKIYTVKYMPAYKNDVSSPISQEEYNTALDTAYSIRDDQVE